MGDGAAIAAGIAMMLAAIPVAWLMVWVCVNRSWEASAGAILGFVFFCGLWTVVIREFAWMGTDPQALAIFASMVVLAPAVVIVARRLLRHKRPS